MCLLRNKKNDYARLSGDMIHIGRFMIFWILSQSLNIHTQLSSGVICLKLALILDLYPYFACARAAKALERPLET